MMLYGWGVIPQMYAFSFVSSIPANGFLVTALFNIVGAIGEDIRKGDAVLARGRRLRPQDAGLLSSIGRAEVSCVRRPRVRLVVTGAETEIDKLIVEELGDPLLHMLRNAIDHGIDVEERRIEIDRLFKTTLGSLASTLQKQMTEGQVEEIHTPDGLITKRKHGV